MPKKMSTAKDSWEEIKQYLPKNWCQDISKNLNKRGIAISAASVSDARSGRIKDLVIQREVWKEIKKVSKTRKKYLDHINSMKTF